MIHADVPLYRHLLVPVDFSEGSVRALREAIRVARAERASLTLLHVCPPPVVPYAMDLPASPTSEAIVHETERVEREAHHRLKQVAGAEVPEDLSWRIVVHSGFAPEVILGEAKKADHDLLVMGTHGRSGVARVVMGSVTERVLHGSPLPVLVVR